MRLPTLLIVIMSAVAMNACGGGSSDKAGGDTPPDVTTLTFANTNGDSAELKPFTDAVARLSGGTLRVQFDNAWRRGETRAEAGLIRDVAAGKADLGASGTRAFDDVGVQAFDALHAPLLIDSYALERAVLEGPLPQSMLPSLKSLDLVGLGILPGPMRKALGVTELTGPERFKGRTIAMQRSQVGERTLEALGARGAEIAAAAPIADFDGVEQQIPSIAGNGYDRVAGKLAANVNLWPRPLVLFANPHAVARLDERQRRALRDAARAAIEPTLEFQRANDAESARALCRRQVVFAVASNAQLATLRRTVRPVHEALAKDPATKAALTEIRDSAAEVGAPPDTAPCSASPPPAKAAAGANAGDGEEPREAAVGKPTPIDGVWEMDSTQKEMSEATGEPASESFSENYGHWRFVLKNGAMRYTQESEGARRWAVARYTVRGDRFTFTITDFGGEAPNGAAEKTGETFDFGWSLDRGRLTLKSIPGKISPENFSVNAWHRP